MLRRTCGLLLWLTIMSLAEAVGVGHHSASQFAEEEVASRGVVTQVRWRNPHVLIYWDAKDPSGKVVGWVGELASVSTVMSEGLTKDSLKPGDEVIFAYRPDKSGKPEAIVGAILRPDGKIVLPFSRQSSVGTSVDRAKRNQSRLKLLAPFGIQVADQ